MHVESASLTEVKTCHESHMVFPSHEEPSVASVERITRVLLFIPNATVVILDVANALMLRG